MTKWSSRLRLVAAVIISFVCGFAIHMVATFDVHSGELRESELEALRQEAAGFFYDTMRELFKGAHDPQRNHVSVSALRTFETYQPRLEPRCWLVNIYSYYGVFYGEVLFPSGDVFEVAMQKTNKGWGLDYLNHMGTKYFYHDLSDKSDQDEAGERRLEDPVAGPSGGLP